MLKKLLITFLTQSLFLTAAFAVEVTPNIGFRHFYAPNGSEYDANNPYRTQSHMQSEYAMNDQILMNHQLGKIVPEFNSIGLDFTFKME